MKWGGIKPSPIAIAGLVGLVWTASSSAVRDFIWADVREGMLDLRALPPNSRRLARGALLLLGVIIVALLLNDVWRANSPLIALTGGRVFRGQLLPVGLLPMTLFLLVVSWSFVLVGALHSHWALRVGLLTIYVLNAIGWANSILASATKQEIWLAGGAIAGVVALFALRWRSQPRPALEFAMLFALVSVIFLISQRQELHGEHLFGIPTGLAKISLNVNYLGGLITPLLLLIGMNIADFTRRASHWVSNILAERAPHGAAATVLVLLLAWRWYFAIAETANRAAKMSTSDYLFVSLGGLGEIAIVGIVWWITARLNASVSPEEEMAEEAAIWARPLVVAFSAVQLSSFVLVGFLMALATGSLFDRPRVLLFAAIDFMTTRVSTIWHVSLGAGAIAISIWLVRRGKRSLAVYLGIFGALQIWWEATTRGMLLGWLHTTQDAVEFCWLAVCAVAMLWWLTKRQLTADRVARLIVLLLILSLIRQRDFIENPFTPFFGFAGIAFVAFSLIWDIATSGSWTNGNSAALPRISRVFIYLGLIILTGTVLNWAVTIHDHDTVEKFTGGAALLGFDRFGKPLLYATFAIALARPATRPITSATKSHLNARRDEQQR